MEKTPLSKYKKIGDTLYTPFTDPEKLGNALQLSSWSQNKLPEYLWIGMIIDALGRRNGLKALNLLIQKLKDSGIFSLSMAEIFELDEDNQKQFWRTVDSHVDKGVLCPLTVAISPSVNEIFYNNYFDFNQDTDDSIMSILNVIRKCMDFHDELTADICFIVVWNSFFNGKLVVSPNMKGFNETMHNYCAKKHEDEEMKLYRPTIRSTFQVVANINGNNCYYAEQFWKTLGEISECEPYKTKWESEMEMDYFSEATKIIEFIAANNEDKKMETKYSVIMGITNYIYHIFEEIVEKKMQNSIGGRILFRTMLESYINLKYIITKEKDEPDIFEKFKIYGLGKYKLVMIKLREQKFTIDEKSQLNDKYLELLVNEEMSEEFIKICLGYFDNIRIKTKFEECNEEKLYSIYYEYTNSFTHGLWGAIRESSMLVCYNPAHRYHDIPDYYGEQELKSAYGDCEMIMRKTFETIEDYVLLPSTV